MTNKKDSLLYSIAFSMLKGIPEAHKIKMLSYYGNAEAIYHQRKNNAIPWPLEAAAAEINFITKHAIQSFALHDLGYPNRLAHITDPPIFLYTKGSSNFNLPQLISIVGTRQHTHQVNKIINELLDGLVHLKMGVISGMALGVDGIAHSLCVEKQIPTWGVLAHGLDTLYPNAHRNLAIKMLQHGGLITECGQKTITMPYQFPKRNRIVAGMSDATIVIETPVEGGSMITAKLANGYDREVFAVPGKLHDAKSKGCLWLIKNNIASLYHDPIHLLENMNWPLPNNMTNYASSSQIKNDATLQQQIHNLSPILQAIYSLIEANAPIHKDQIAQKLDIKVETLSAHLLDLELNNLILLQAGNQYIIA